MYYTLPCNVHQPVTVLAQRLPRPIAVTIQLVLAYRTSRELGLKPRLIRKIPEGQLWQTVRASALVVDPVKIFLTSNSITVCFLFLILCAGMYEVPNFLGCAGAPPFWMGLGRLLETRSYLRCFTVPKYYATVITRAT